MQQTLSNTLLNSFAISGTKNQIQAGPDNSLLSRSALRLTYPEIYPSNRFGTGPDVTLTGFTGYNAGDYIKNQNSTIQVRDDLSKVMGEHAFKFGTQITYSQKDQNTRPRENGVVTFATGARNSTGNVVADALLGIFQNYHGRRDRSGVAGALLAVRVLRAGQLARLAEADARHRRALQHHRAALQRVEQLLDVRSGPLRSVARADRARERRLDRRRAPAARPTASSSSATASRTRRTA